MACYGYAQISSIDQDYVLQEKALRAAGCEIVRAEKVSGTSRHSRTELELLLEFLHEGDTLMVTRVDRFARSIKDLQDIKYDQVQDKIIDIRNQHVIIDADVAELYGVIQQVSRVKADKINITATVESARKTRAPIVKFSTVQFVPN